MYKKMSKFSAVLIMLSLVLSACGASSTNTKGADATPASTPAATTVKAEEPKPVELLEWTATKTASDAEKKEREDFLKKYPYITFKTVVHEGDPGNDYFQGVAAGNAPDMIQASNTVLDKYIKSGILQPLGEFTKDWDDLKNFNPKLLEGLTRNGQLYGIPTRSFPMYFGYNKKIFKDANISAPPKTWNEMLDVAKKLTNPDKQIAGYGMLSGQWTEWFFQYYVWQAGGDLTKKNDDGTLSLTFTDPAVIKAANFYKDLRKAKVTQSDVTMKFEDMVKNFAAGKFAMMPFASDWVSWAVSLGMKVEDIGIAEFPAGPSGKTTAAISSGAWGINPKSSKEKQAAAFEWIKWNTRKDYYVNFFKDQASKGAVNPEAPVRTDIKLDEIVTTMDPAWRAVQEAALKNNRDEFYGKATVGKYVDQAVSKIAVDPNADPEKEFAKSQELATKEVLEKFNADVKAGK